MPLQKEGAAMRCANGHTFDFSRSGYLNLLQPQDRRSKTPGDAAAAVAARRRLHELGVTGPLAGAIGAFLRPGGRVLDAGCGDGFYLGTLAASVGFSGHGVDISTPAIEAAAKRFPACEWIVANADRMIPYTDGAFSAVVSITARRNPPEFHRVLEAGGQLLIAVPAPDDLIELRGEGKDLRERTIVEFASLFSCLETRRVTTSAALPPEAVRDLRLAIYRPRGHVETETVTFSLDLLLFRRD